LTQVPAPGMLMATAAGKHLTIFRKGKPKKAPGRPKVKKKFAEIASKTAGTVIRADRNEVVRKEMLAAELKTGKRYVRSGATAGPAAGKFYELNAGETVTQAIRRRGLEAILVNSPPSDW